MSTFRNRWPLIVIAAYLLAVVFCILQAFDYAGSINFDWTLAVIGLTLPWSLVSVALAWSLIHGASLEFFTFMYLVFAVLNSLLFYWLRSLFRRSL